MAEHKCEPVAWMIDWPDEPELGHYFAEDPTDTGRSQPLHTAAQLAEEVERAVKAERERCAALCEQGVRIVLHSPPMFENVTWGIAEPSPQLAAAIRTADDGAQHG